MSLLRGAANKVSTREHYSAGLFQSAVSKKTCLHPWLTAAGPTGHSLWLGLQRLRHTSSRLCARGLCVPASRSLSSHTRHPIAKLRLDRLRSGVGLLQG